MAETSQWDYGEGYDKPLATFIRRGGWNNGLYHIEPQAVGGLKRLRTAAADAYRDVIAKDRC